MQWRPCISLICLHLLHLAARRPVERNRPLTLESVTGSCDLFSLYRNRQCSHIALKHPVFLWKVCQTYYVRFSSEYCGGGLRTPEKSVTSVPGWFIEQSCTTRRGKGCPAWTAKPAMVFSIALLTYVMKFSIIIPIMEEGLTIVMIIAPCVRGRMTVTKLFPSD